eukprot:539454_1
MSDRKKKREELSPYSLQMPQSQSNLKSADHKTSQTSQSKARTTQFTSPIQICNELINTFNEDKERQQPRRNLASIVEKADEKCGEELIDFARISQILSEYDIFIDETALKNDFSNYTKNSFMTEICDAYHNKEDDLIQLSQILINGFGCDDYKKRQKIFDIILYKYISKNELNDYNFITILIKIASMTRRVQPHILEFSRIARASNLRPEMFVDKTSTFEPEHFAQYFGMADHGPRHKDMYNIYTKIVQWQPSIRERYEPYCLGVTTKSISCIAINRMVNTLIYHSTIDLLHSDKHKEDFLKYINESYETKTLLDDYIHIIELHNSDIDEMYNLLHNACTLMNVCDFQNCALLFRHYRDRNTNKFHEEWK